MGIDRIRPGGVFNPQAPRMEYVPAKLGNLWGFYVGKYSSTMEPMGKIGRVVSVIRVAKP